VPARALHRQTAQRRDPRQSLKSAPHKPLKTKAKHSQAPRPQETPVLLWYRTKHTHVPKKALRTRRKAFCKAPRSLTTSHRSRRRFWPASRPQRNKCNRMQHEIEKPLPCNGPGGGQAWQANPDRTMPQERNQTQHKSQERPPRNSAHALRPHHRTLRSEPKFFQPRNAKRNFN
jgi:hypothetical protein